ncbi:hypothetical protein SLS58_006965 [Diplodia intermedia]|uniref:F-box domain-containing protein n=1 Tax=Diplodia intermedia TaxID=856260 RepID=A0ABR3TLJ3_9PEZI
MSTPPAPFHPSLNSPALRAFGGVPNEIALKIIEFITRKRDLANLALTCKDLRLLTLPFLYEHIYINESDWSAKDLYNLTSPSNPVSKEIRDITLVRPQHRGQFFYAHWPLLFAALADDQLRSVRIICSATGSTEFPSDFLDHMFQHQRNLLTLDLRWPPRYLSRTPLEEWILPDTSMLTSLTISVHCRSDPCMAEAAGMLLAGAVNLRHLFFKEILNFSDLQSVTLRECMRKPGNFLFMIADLHPDTKIRDIVIEGGCLEETEIHKLHRFRNLQHLVLAGVDILYSWGASMGTPYTAREGFIQVCEELSQRKTATLRTLCVEAFTKLVSSFPALEELWVSLPVPSIRDRNPNIAGAEMQSFLNTIAQAPRLRLVCTLRTPENRQHISAPYDTLVDFYESNPWLPNVAYAMFRQSAAANPALRVVAFGCLPAGREKGRLRAFVRRPKVAVSGRFETLIEEISANELFLEEDFYFWDMFEQFEFEGQYGTPTYIADVMDTSA